MKRRHAALGFPEICARSESLRDVDCVWAQLGYAVTGYRTWPRRDGSTTVRVVWRKRDAAVVTVTCIVRVPA